MNWIKQLFSRHRRYDELSESIREHLDEKIADLMDRGMTREEAVHAARREFGNVTRIEERSREVWQWSAINGLWADFRYALRRLGKSLGFSAIVILTLALGIGAVTAVFQVAEEALFHPLQYQNADRIVMLWDHEQSQSEQRLLMSATEMRELAQDKLFSAVAGIDLKQLSFALTGTGKPRQIAAAHVTHNFFNVLGVQPFLGQGFGAKAATESSEATAIISHRLWEEDFHSDPNVLGKSIDLDGVGYTVVAVMPANFRFPIRYQDEDLEAWMPESLDPMLRIPMLRNAGTMLAFARIPSGVDLVQEQQRVNAAYARLLEQHPEMNQDRVVRLYPLNDELAGAHRTELYLLLAAVAVLLLVACTNVANLLFARGVARRQELAVRVALGAERMTLVRQLLTENILLACLGTLLSLVIAKIGARMLARYIQAQPGGTGFAHLLSAPSLANNGFSGAAFLFVAGVLTLTVVLAGLAPALMLSRADGMELVNGQGRASASKQVMRMRAILLIGQISFSMVLAVGAMLLVQSFRNFIAINPGFVVQHRLTYQLTLPTAKYPSDAVQARFFHDLMARVQALPGVELAAIIGGLPLTTWMKLGPFLPDSISVSRPADMPIAQNRSVSENYFSVMEIPVLKGRTLREGAAGNSPKELVISQSLAKLYWPNASPIGHHIKFGLDPSSPTYTIVGVVGDVHQSSLDKNTGAEYYQSYWNDPDRSMGLVVKTTLAPMIMDREVQGALHSLDPEQPFAHVASFDNLVYEASQPQRIQFTLLGMISAVALLLTAIGIFGLISYLVTQRTREIGIRLALGSGRRRVISTVLKDAAKLIAVGMGAGIVIALGLSHLIRHLLFQVSAFNPAAYVGAGALVIVFALMACILPASRAARIDPVAALRME